MIVENPQNFSFIILQIEFLCYELYDFMYEDTSKKYMYSKVLSLPRVRYQSFRLSVSL